MAKEIVILDGYVANPGDLSWYKLNTLGEVTVYDNTPESQIVERCTDAFAIYTNKVVITDQIMTQLPNLKFIGVLATGYNNVDIEAANKRGITVCNVPAYSTNSVVQLVFAHLLNVVDNVQKHSDSVFNGDWTNCENFSYRLSPMLEIAGLTMGVYGLGNIGSKVAKIANAFGMKVISFTSKSQEQLPEYITKVSKSEMFEQCDVLSLNAPLTKDNKEFINAETLALMKPTAILINTARGGLVNEQDLADVLNNDKLYAACLDVLDTEPALANNPLLRAKNCYITPHIAWQSDAARQSLLDISFENLKAFIEGKPQNVVR